MVGRGKKLSNIKRANIGTNKRLKERRTQIISSRESHSKPGGFSKNDKRGKPKKAMFAFAAAQKAGYFTNKRINYQSKPSEIQEERETEKRSDGEEDDEDLIEEDMEEEDLEYIQSLGGKAAFLSNIEDSMPESSKSRKGKKQEKDNKVASYEEQPRSMKHRDGQQATNMKPLLPIKHAGGLEYRWTEEEKEEGEEEMEEEDAEEEIEMEQENDTLPAITTIQLFAERQDKINQKKQRIATLASAIVEDPEKNVTKLKDLRILLEEREPSIMVTTRKLAMVSLGEVFKDIAPGYRIREWGDKAKSSQPQLSKDVQVKREFEEGLVTNYRLYLEYIEKTINEVHKTKAEMKKAKEKEAQRTKPRMVLPDQAKVSLAETATKCLCSLLNALPHFNYRTNIISVVANRMTSVHEKIATTCCQCMKQLFRRDSTGDASLEAVRFISRIARNNGYQVSPEVLNTFLSLRIKEVKTGHTAEENRKKMLQERKEKFKRYSRNQKRYHKKLEVLEKELQATEASENKNKKLKLHTEIVQIVFATYFRILKRASHSVMLPAVLEGLAKFAHLINVEFFDDLIQVLHALVHKGDLKYRESLHCTLTAFHILSGQGDVLNIDPSRFYSHLYMILPQVHAGISSDDAKLVCDCLEVMISRRRKQISVHRVMGFLKRLTTLSTLALPNAALAYLNALRTFMKWYTKTDVLLDNESTGSGTFMPEIEDPEHCHAHNTALWELTLIEDHYHPTVRQYAKYVSNGCPLKGEGVPHLQLLRMDPKDVLKTYNTDTMKFNPPLPPKNPVISKKALKAKRNHPSVSAGPFVQNDFQDIVDLQYEVTVDGMDFSSAIKPDSKDVDDMEFSSAIKPDSKDVDDMDFSSAIKPDSENDVVSTMRRPGRTFKKQESRIKGDREHLRDAKMNNRKEKLLI
ncbi:nucleolar complex protein 3 homolog isoform X2 [Lytechinus variegatus]|nr:nucleolar complex protein 3 homolog isoform X2 [Lytechinus variegatus]